MSTRVEICNLALFRIGQSITIQDVNEQSKAAIVCKGAWDLCRDTVLQDMPWPFATKAKALALVDDAPPGWAYQYDYPSDCLQLVNVCTSDGIRVMSSVTWWAGDWCGDGGVRWQMPKVPYRVLAGPSEAHSVVLVTDLSEAYAFYVSRVENPVRYPPLFVDALAWRLAAEIGTAMTASQSLVKDAHAAYYSMRNRAAAAAFNEAVPDREPESPSIQVRG